VNPPVWLGVLAPVNPVSGVAAGAGAARPLQGAEDVPAEVGRCLVPEAGWMHRRERSTLAVGDERHVPRRGAQAKRPANGTGRLRTIMFQG
jgi:hypothetical protein